MPTTPADEAVTVVISADLIRQYRILKQGISNIGLSEEAARAISGRNVFDLADLIALHTADDLKAKFSLSEEDIQIIQKLAAEVGVALGNPSRLIEFMIETQDKVDEAVTWPAYDHHPEITESERYDIREGGAQEDAWNEYFDDLRMRAVLAVAIVTSEAPSFDQWYGDKMREAAS